MAKRKQHIADTIEEAHEQQLQAEEDRIRREAAAARSRQYTVHRLIEDLSMMPRTALVRVCLTQNTAFIEDIDYTVTEPLIDMIIDEGVVILLNRENK